MVGQNATATTGPGNVPGGQPVGGDGTTRSLAAENLNLGCLLATDFSLAQGGGSTVEYFTDDGLGTHSNGETQADQGKNSGL